MLQQQAQELSEAHAEFRLLQAGFEFEEAVQVVNHHALDVPELVGVDLHALPLLIDRLAHQFGQRVAGLHRDINGQRVKAAPLVRRALQVDVYKRQLRQHWEDLSNIRRFLDGLPVDVDLRSQHRRGELGVKFLAGGVQQVPHILLFDFHLAGHLDRVGIGDVRVDVCGTRKSRAQLILDIRDTLLCLGIHALGDGGNRGGAADKRGERGGGLNPSTCEDSSRDTEDLRRDVYKRQPV